MKTVKCLLACIAVLLAAHIYLNSLSGRSLVFKISPVDTDIYA